MVCPRGQRHDELHQEPIRGGVRRTGRVTRLRRAASWTPLPFRREHAGAVRRQASHLDRVPPSRVEDTGPAKRRPADRTAVRALDSQSGVALSEDAAVPRALFNRVTSYVRELEAAGRDAP